MAESVAQLFRVFSDTHQFLGGMTSEQKEQLAALASVRKFANRQPIARLGAPVDGIYFIIRGSIRLENIVESGDRFLSGDLMAGDVFGFLSVLDGKRPSHHATSNGACTAIFVPAHQFREFIFSDLELTKAMLQFMCLRVRMSLISFNRFAPGSLTARVARCLLNYIDQLGFHPEKTNRKQIAINQYDIAAMLAVSRQSVHRVLKELEADGILEVGYNSIDIHDLPKLRSLQST
ncbi:Crp/Fnr family transcriptional regulator [Martelella soudanensis]|uniref:Crp/Fnr family transcriptional regulator n=1 Tax=unclassified Martelella TaxID=2629616 RepID=UPI0015DFA2E7|nr:MULTISPECIES: Crp/Fnr family transcriptional regulator [unclassified Martelella]